MLRMFPADQSSYYPSGGGACSGSDGEDYSYSGSNGVTSRYSTSGFMSVCLDYIQQP